VRLEQWHDLVELLRTGPVSRGLRRRVERWMLGLPGEAGGADLATAALQAGGSLLGGELRPEDHVPALLALGLAEDVLAAGETGVEPGAIWAPCFEALGRRLAWSVARRVEAAEQELERRLGPGDEVLDPIAGRVRAWLAAAGRCSWMGLGRAPGLFVFESRGQGVVADVAVLVEQGLLGRPGIQVEARFGRNGPGVALSESSVGAVRLGVLLGLLVGELRAQMPEDTAERRRRWNELTDALALPPEPEPDEAGIEKALEAAQEQSAWVRRLWAAGTRIEVALGLGGLPGVLGGSLGAAVAAATARALEEGPGRGPARWDTGLTGGLSGRGRLLAVRGLSSKTQAAVQGRLAALVGPAANAEALRELQAGLHRATPLQIRAEDELLAAIEFEPAAPAASAAASARRLRSKAAAAVLTGLAATLLLLVGSMSIKERAPRGPIPSRATALVTWPSWEWGCRISPDGKRILFFSDRNGRTGLWVGNLEGPDFQELASSSAGVLTSAAWSPDCRSIALASAEGTRTLLQVVATSDGAIQRSEWLSIDRPRLVHWLPWTLYLTERIHTVWRFELETSRLERVFSDPRLSMSHGIDLLPGGKKFVFSARDERQQDLWSLDLSGGPAQRLTEDAEPERSPNWLGPDGRFVVYASEASGEINLWKLALADRSKHQLTFSGTEEYVEDVSPQGSMMVLGRVEKRSELWSLDLRTGSRTQLTADRLQDSGGSVAARSRQIAFQRSKPSRRQAMPFDMRIYLMRWDANAAQSPLLSVADGYSPRISSDGRWLAYLRPASRSAEDLQLVNRPDLWLQDLESGKTYRVADRFGDCGFNSFPLEWVALNLVWSPNSEELLFVRTDPSGRPEIRRLRAAGLPGEMEPIAGDFDPGEEVRDLMLSGDGRRLSYVQVSGDAGTRFRLWTVDRVSGRLRVLLEENASGAELVSRGWLEDGQVLVLRSRLEGERWRVEILSIDQTGAAQILDSVDSVEPNTSRLDPLSWTLYMTRAEGSIHNLYAYSIREKKWRKLTENHFPGVSFGGVDTALPGHLIYTRHANHRDLWRIELEP
jgi:Tol biopolymer transport system component